MRPVVPFVLAVVACALTKTQTPAAADSLPVLNRAIVAFVVDHMGRKVDRGECWDLAAGALNQARARWDGAYAFGRLLDWRKDTILPGDIVQFERVTVERRTADRMERLSFGHHTAVIMTVHGRGSFTLGHQNFGKAGRKVSLLDLEMAQVRAGKVVIYRPVR